MKTVLIIAGDEALEAYLSGERNQRILRRIGLCLSYKFERDKEVQSFIKGLELAAKLEDFTYHVQERDDDLL